MRWLPALDVLIAKSSQIVEDNETNRKARKNKIVVKLFLMGLRQHCLALIKGYIIHLNSIRPYHNSQRLIFFQRYQLRMYSEYILFDDVKSD